jgi:hypothetical protein
MFKLVVVAFLIMGPGGSAVPMQTTVMPGTYQTCPNAGDYKIVPVQGAAPGDVRVSVLCVPAGVAGKQ